MTKANTTLSGMVLPVMTVAVARARHRLPTYMAVRQVDPIKDVAVQKTSVGTKARDLDKSIEVRTGKYHECWAKFLPIHLWMPLFKRGGDDALFSS